MPLSSTLKNPLVSPCVVDTLLLMGTGLHGLDPYRDIVEALKPVILDAVTSIHPAWACSPACREGHSCSLPLHL